MLKKEWMINKFLNFNSAPRVVYIDKQLKNIFVGGIEYVSNSSFLNSKKCSFGCHKGSRASILAYYSSFFSLAFYHHRSIAIQSQLTIHFATYRDFSL